MISRYQTFIFYLALSFPAFLYLYLLANYSINIPRGDDYDLFLNYLNHSDHERLHLLFAQHNEHRLVFSRTVAECMYRLLGHIDFQLLAWMGSVPLFIFAYIFLGKLKSNQIPAILLIPIPYLLFLGPFFENTSWATGSLQNYYVLVFAYISLALFDKKDHASLTLSIAFATLAALTSGSGLFVFLALLAWASQSFYESGRASKPHEPPFSAEAAIRLVVTTLCFLTLLYFYFKNYTKPPHHPSIADALLNPLHSLHYFLVFTGSYTLNTRAAALTGVASTLFFCYLTHQKYFRKNPIIYYFLIFLFLNAAATAITRSGFGVTQALASRYGIISMLISICLYFSAIETKATWFSNKRLQSALISLVFIAGMLSFRVQMHYLTNIKDKLTTGAVQWSTSGAGLDYPDQNRATTLLRKASEKGYYQLPQTHEDMD